MPRQSETTTVARKVLPIIYVLDTSGSMSGDRIAAVNEAMHETMELLADISNKNPDAEIKIAVLKFSSGAEWVTNGLVFTEDFFWNDLRAGGVTDYGAALRELNAKLSRSEFLKSDTGFCVPVILFLSDGQPTDDYEKALDNIISNNKWFRHSTKIALAVGSDADKNVLAKVAGNVEAVVSVDDVDTLKMLIKVASVTSSVINSVSHPSLAGDNNAVEIIRQTQASLGDAADKIGTNLSDTIHDDNIPSADPGDTSGGWDDDDDDWN